MSDFVKGTNVPDDSISRRAAIELVKAVCDAIMSGCKSHYDTEVGDEVYDDTLEVDAILKCNKGIRNALRDMPSAQPERKTGKWQETDDGWDGVFYVCSECGCSWTLIDGTPSDNGMNFCPHCGTKMVEVVEKLKEDEEGEDDEQTD